MEAAIALDFVHDNHGRRPMAQEKGRPAEFATRPDRDAAFETRPARGSPGAGARRGWAARRAGRLMC